ncbi:MAG: hypothetical protein ACQES4_09110 [Bacillota bacterium]
MIDKIFEDLVNQYYELLPEFGKHLALDGKAIDSRSRGRNGNKRLMAYKGFELH